MSERSERVISALRAFRTGGPGRNIYVLQEKDLRAVLDALGDDPAQATVERVQALLTRDPVTWDDWHTLVTDLRAALNPETGP